MKMTYMFHRGTGSIVGDAAEVIADDELQLRPIRRKLLVVSTLAGLESPLICPKREVLRGRRIGKFIS